MPHVCLLSYLRVSTPPFTQVEIDEYRDYDKAAGALKESMKCLVKSKLADKDQKLDSLKKRVGLVEKFIVARNMVANREQATEMIRLCSELLATPDVETAIRSGDVFAFLIEYHAHEKQWPQAYKLLEEMQNRGINTGPYIDKDILTAVQQASGKPLAAASANQNQGSPTRGNADRSLPVSPSAPPEDVVQDEVMDEEVLSEEEEKGGRRK